MFILISLKTERNCEICKGTKITRAPCRRRNGGAVLRAENFGDLITADHKVLSENCESRNNHRYVIVVQDLASQWIQSYPCKTKTSQATQRSLQKFLEPDKKPKVIYTDNSLEFGKSCEDLSWNHGTSTPHRSETNGIAERAVRRVKEGTSAVLLQSGLNESWWADSMECYTYLRNLTDLLSDGKTPYERRFGQPFKGPTIPFGSLVEYHPMTAKDQSRILHFRKNVLPGLFLGYALYAGWIWKGDVLFADLEELETMDASEIYSKRLNAKEVIFPKEKGEFIFPIADGKTLGGDQDLRTSTLIRQRPIQGESHVDFLGESEGSLPPPHDSFPDAGEAINDFWSMSGNLHTPPSRWTQSQALLAERRIIPYSTEIHWRHQNYSYEFGCQARATHRWLLEYRWVKRLVRSLDRFHTIYSIGRKTSWRIYVVRGEMNEKTVDIQARSFMTRTLGQNGKECQLKEKQKWSHESSILITHENCEGSISLTRRTRNSRRPSRMLVRNWKHQWLLLCRVKLWKIVGVVHPTKLKQNLRVFWKLMSLEDCVWENHCRLIVKTILQEEETIHYSIIIWFTNSFLCLNAMKIPAAQAAVDKECEKNGEIFCVEPDVTKVRSKKEVIDEARTKGAKVHFAPLMDMLFEECLIGSKAPKIQKVESYSEVILWKIILDLMQYSLNKDHQHHKWKQQKSWISSQDCLVAQDKQLSQYLLIPR